MPTTIQLEQDRQKQLLSLAMRREISRASDADQLRQAVEARAETLEQAPKIDNAQVRNLENIAYSTEKISDITDYLKQQIGRSKGNERWRYRNVGADILTDLLGQNLDPAELEAIPRFLLREEVERIMATLHQQNLALPDEDFPRRLHLALCREYVRHLVANYLYYRAVRRGDSDSSDSD